MIINQFLINMQVYHKRYQPKIYDFSHKVLYLLLPLHEVNHVRTKLFSINKFNFFSLFLRDYGMKKIHDPVKYIRQIFGKFNIKSEDIKNISILTMPKILGRGFNPVSFWLCFSKEQKLCAIIAEVNNTFGERHSYLCYNHNLTAITKADIINHKKVFHVSPFCHVKGRYEFKFDINNKNLQINIDYYETEDKLISTVINGEYQQLSDRNLIKYLLQLPFMTFKVIFLIHYHALRLWLNKIPYIKKPKQSDQDIT